jgi:hypothetical protein
MMKHGDSAWATIGLGVLVYELYAPPGQLLSERVDCYRMRYPILTNAVILYLALHLLRVWPQPVDPLHQIAIRKTRR